MGCVNSNVNSPDRKKQGKKNGKSEQLSGAQQIDLQPRLEKVTKSKNQQGVIDLEYLQSSNDDEIQQSNNKNRQYISNAKNKYNCILSQVKNNPDNFTLNTNDTISPRVANISYINQQRTKVTGPKYFNGKEIPKNDYNIRINKCGNNQKKNSKRRLSQKYKIHNQQQNLTDQSHNIQRQNLENYHATIMLSPKNTQIKYSLDRTRQRCPRNQRSPRGSSCNLFKTFKDDLIQDDQIYAKKQSNTKSQEKICLKNTIQQQNYTPTQLKNKTSNQLGVHNQIKIPQKKISFQRKNYVN